MSTPTLAILIASSALVVATATHAVQVVMQRRLKHRKHLREAAEMEDERIQQHPNDYVLLEHTRHDATLALLATRLEAAMATERDARRALAEMPPTVHTGVRLALRSAALLVLLVVIVVAALLNVEIFVAVNGGVADEAAVGKGLGATMAELLLALAVADVLRNRKALRSMRKKVELAAAVGLLIAIVGLVTQYAPARSEQAFAVVIDNAERQLAFAEAAQAEDRTEFEAASVMASRNQVQDLRQRLDRGRHSDAALAVFLPGAEVLVGGLGVEGLVLLKLLAQRAQRRRRVRKAKDAVATLNREIERANAATEVRIRERLWSLGVCDVTIETRPRSRLQSSLRHPFNGSSLEGAMPLAQHPDGRSSDK